MLKEKNLKHMLAIARYMYHHADEVYDNPTEEQRRDLWMLGFLHDVGREFSEKDGDYHGKVGSRMIWHYTFTAESQRRQAKPSLTDAIHFHGIHADDSKELKLLNRADLMFDSHGHRVSVDKRLEDIKRNHGRHSVAYKTAKNLKKKLFGK